MKYVHLSLNLLNFAFFAHFLPWNILVKQGIPDFLKIPAEAPGKNSQNWHWWSNFGSSTIDHSQLSFFLMIYFKCGRMICIGPNVCISQSLDKDTPHSVSLCWRQTKSVIQIFNVWSLINSLSYMCPLNLFSISLPESFVRNAIQNLKNSVIHVCTQKKSYKSSLTWRTAEIFFQFAEYLPKNSIQLRLNMRLNQTFTNSVSVCQTVYIIFQLKSSQSGI